ncbi:MAG: Peroxide stress regulator PerR, family, partial [Bryobacterales bacterium]|nr:Peroxide stress regulator PerR, family [Bryobacterales bacterium]
TAAEAAQMIEEAFQRTGVRRTPQRFFVLEHLLLRRDHATVEELCQAVNKVHALASRATVYNTLHALVEAGLVREFTLDGKAARYDANLEPHHHFICDKCGAVEDVEWFDLPEDSKADRFRAFEVILRGTCIRCQ